VVDGKRYQNIPLNSHKGQQVVGAITDLIGPTEMNPEILAKMVAL